MPLAGQEAESDTTVWAGVYSAEQARRGERIYQRRCKKCHRDDLSAACRPSIEAPRQDGLTASGRELSTVVTRASKDARSAGLYKCA